MEKDTINFAWMIVSGIEMLGMVSDDSYSGWLVGKSKMVVYQPRFISREIEQSGAIHTPGAQPRVLIKIAPITVLSTSQERVSVNPDVVEILAKLETEEGATTCSPYSDTGNCVGLYREYAEAMRTWREAINKKFKTGNQNEDSSVIDMFKGKH